MTRETGAQLLRQVLVIGEEAQARIGQATVLVEAPGFEGDVQALYSARAGFARIDRRETGGDAQEASTNERFELRSPTASAMLAGARAAAREIARVAKEAGA